MRKTVVLVAALGLGIGGLVNGEAAAGKLVPGGWLEAPPIPKIPPPRVDKPPAAARPAPHRHRRTRRHRMIRRPPPANGRVRF